MFEPRERVVVAVSGGSDSLGLLYILKALNAELCLKLSVASLDHGLRQDSAQDVRFVKKTAEELGIPFFSDALDWRRISKEGSLEDLLKKLRYDFLFGACRKFRAKKLALGHTKDDQAETVLMRLLRGSGLYGMSAILPKRRVVDVEIVRPLIEVSKSDILKYLKNNGLSYRVDKTNLEDVFTRNKIRNDLLPLLEKRYNPNIKEVLSNFALSVGADYDYLERQADVFLKKNLQRSPKKCSVGIAPLLKLDIALRRIVLRRMVELLQGHLRKLAFKHWQEVEDLLESRPFGSQVHLPDKVIVLKSQRRLAILKR